MKTNDDTLPRLVKPRSFDRRHCASVILALAALQLCVLAAPASEPQIPANAKALHRKVATKLKPSVREWISIEAKKIADAAIGETAVTADVKGRFAGQQLREADIEILVTLVFMQAAQDAAKELQVAREEIKAANRQKGSLRQTAATVPDHGPPGDSQVSLGTERGANTSEIDQVQSLRLQVAIDRSAKLVEALAKPKASVSKSQIRRIGNLR